MMGLYVFNDLNIDDKAELVWKDGKFIDNYVDENCKSNLYYLYDFYVEVIYSAKDNCITEINSFKKGHRLDKYVNKVELNKLFDRN